MAKDTYLQMVSDMITETGLNGGDAPSSVTTASGDAAKVVYWIRVADLQIQRERIDFDFLWGLQDSPLAEGSAVVSAPFDQPDDDDPNTRTVLVNSIAKDRLAVLDSNGEAHFPEYLDWNEFSLMFNYETQPEENYSSYWSVRPDRVILLSNPIASPDYVCRYEYWRKPLQLRDNDDVSRIPDDFGRLIILLAKVLYAEHEDAPEVEQGSTAMYNLMLNQMISVHTPMAEWQRMENSDRFLQVETR